MSDQDLGKKMVEEIELQYFVDAYKHVTRKGLFGGDRGEKPDFICYEDDGSPVGVELTYIVRDPETEFVERVLEHREYMDSTAALDFVFERIATKTHRMTKNSRIDIGKTILVLQLMDCPLSELVKMLDGSLRADFGSSSFAEIWLADYTGIDAYGDVELFGLYPSKWWGYRRGHNRDQKPYG